MYLTLVESFVIWLESRASSSTNAVLRAAVAFSVFALVIVTSAALLLDMFAGIPIESWMDDNQWSIWAAAALIALLHWRVGFKVAKRHEAAKSNNAALAPPRFIWLWYFIPVVAMFLATAMLTLARTTP